MALLLIWILVLVLFAGSSAVASYLRLLLRRLTPMASRKLFQANDTRRIRADSERVGVSISALHGAAMALFSVGLAGLFFFWRSTEVLGNLGRKIAHCLAAVRSREQVIPLLGVGRPGGPEGKL